MATTTIYASSDTYVRQSSPGSNYNGDDYFVVGKTGTGTQLDRALLALSLSSLTGKIINSARLYLRQVYSDYAGSGITPFTVRRILESWTPSSVTWSNQPDSSGLAIVSASLSGNATGWRNFDITDLIKDTIENDRTFAGLKIMADESLGNTRKNFSSKEAGYTPYLVVDYSEGGFRARSGGVWKQAKGVYVRSGGTWKQGRVFARSGGVWKPGK